MWRKNRNSCVGFRKFFFLILCHTDLSNYYRMNFSMMQYHKYSLTELEEMLPFEREIYIQLLIEHLREEEERRKQNG